LNETLRSHVARIKDLESKNEEDQKTAEALTEKANEALVSADNSVNELKDQLKVWKHVCGMDLAY
jgi:hypothetical protein